MVMAQLDAVPSQLPPQLLTSQSLAGVAVRVTEVPCGNVASQAEVQSIPAGFETILP